MTKYEMLDRILTGEPVEATEDVMALAELAEEIESIFTGPEPTQSASRRGLNASLEAFREADPVVVVRPTRTRRVAARALVAAAMLVALPTVGWAASENALPGDLMYPVKRAFEQVRLAVAGSPLDEAAVLLDQAGERLAEAATARAVGREDAVRPALEAYAAVMDGFQARVAEARAQGLDVSALMVAARDLMQRHEALLDALIRTTRGAEPRTVGQERPGDTVPPAPPGPPEGQPGQQGKAGDGGKPDDKPGGRGEGNPGGKGKTEANTQGGAEGSPGGGGSGEGQAGGGSGGGSGGGDAPPATENESEVQPEEPDDHPGNGNGFGHDKAKGKGHEKAKGKGHTEG